MKRIITIALAIIPFVGIMAQEYPDYSHGTAFYGGLFSPESPEAMSMIQYGTTEMSLYTGRISPEIPLYEYKDADFDIPISLNYSCSGLKPGQSSGNFGYGWNLGVVGVITREIRGIADEAMSREYSSKHEGDSFIEDFIHVMSSETDYYSLPRLYQTAMMMREVNVDGYAVMYEGETDVDEFDYAYTGEFGNEFMLCREVEGNPFRYVEVEPDLYHYSFMGYNGSFILQPDHQVVITDSNTPSGELTIEYDWHRNQPLNSIFVITVGDGTRFTFGCREETLSYELAGETNDDNHTISSWKLTRIEKQTGRTAIFQYAESSGDQFTSYMPFITIDHLMVHALSDGEGNYVHTWERANPTEVRHILTNLTENKHLSKIIISDRATINFEYAAPMPATSEKLLSLNVVNSANDTVKHCSFSYERPSSSSQTILLSGIGISGVGSYSLDYYDKTLIPQNNTVGIDWMGYYSGSTSWYSYSSLNMNNLSQSAQTLRNALSSYNESKTKIGMLKSITYPTGGRSEYTFGINRYSYTLSTNNHSTGQSGAVTGGLRIEKIEDFDSDGTCMRSRSYSYVMEDGYPSGVLLDIPRVHYHYKLETNDIELDREVVTTSGGLGFGKRSPIEYLRVVETIEGEGGRAAVNEYRFVSSVDGPFVETYITPSNSVQTNDGWEISFTDLGSDSNEGERRGESLTGGRLYSEKNYEGYISSANLRRSIENTYSTYRYAREGSSFVTCPAVLRSRYETRRISTLSSFESSATEKKYNSSGAEILSLTKNKQLNNNGRVNRFSSTDSRNRQLYETMTYHPARPAFLTERKQFIGGVLQSAEKYDYDTLHVSGDRFVLLPTLVSRGRISGGTMVSYYPKYYIDRYDQYGNPVQFRDAMGNITSFLWGYNGQYLTAKVEGATYDSIVNSSISALRSTSGLLVSSWTWKPLVGMTSFTDPSGRTQSFGYDTSGRLASETYQNNLMKEYIYNVVNNYDL